MPQRDSDHAAVRRAVVADGWTITHDPSTITFAGDRTFIDLGAKRLLAVTRADRAIAVEVKPCGELSVIADVQQAIGQYVLDRSWLARVAPRARPVARGERPGASRRAGPARRRRHPRAGRGYRARPVVVCDEARDRYLLLDVGWDGPRRVHEAILHLQLADGTIRIEHDGSPPPGAAAALIVAGMPREDIVLAFHPPRMRAFAGSATA